MHTASSAAAATVEPHTTTARRSPGRPWAKGTSGNPAGARQDKPVDVGTLARRYARRAIAALVRQLASDDAQASVEAARTLLAHGYGEPVEHHAVHLPPISVVCHAKPEPARANGKDSEPHPAWDAD